MTRHIGEKFKERYSTKHKQYHKPEQYLEQGSVLSLKGKNKTAERIFKSFQGENKSLLTQIYDNSYVSRTAGRFKTDTTALADFFIPSSL